MIAPKPRRAVYPGSFDPVTYGHLDIVGRSAQLYDELWVTVFQNSTKSSGLFSVDERIELLEATTADMPNVIIAKSSGLVVDFCNKHSIDVIVKGVRAVSDFDYELQMAQMNYGLGAIETLMMPTNPLYSFLSSSLVKDAARWGGDVTSHVPELVAKRLYEKLQKQ